MPGNLAQQKAQSFRPQAGRLLRLGEEDMHPGAARSGYLILGFLRSVRDGQTVGILVGNRVAVREDHVVMGAVALDVRHGKMPVVRDVVVEQRHFFPAGEGAHDLHGFHLGMRTGGRMPAEIFCVGRFFPGGVVALVRRRSGRVGGGMMCRLMRGVGMGSAGRFVRVRVRGSLG